MKRLIRLRVCLLLTLLGSLILSAQAQSWTWAVSPGTGKSYATTTDALGNVYLTGYFRDTATFGTTTLISTGQGDMFVAKLSANGSYLWAMQGGSSGVVRSNDVAVDSSGNVYVSGAFLDTATFGNTTLTSAGDYDVFVAKLTSSGAYQWAVRAGGSSGDGASNIAVDGSGNVVATGAFSDTATFGNNTYTSTGMFDLFIARLSPTGSWQWVETIQNASTSASAGISDAALDGAGNVYVAGPFRGTCTIGGNTLTSLGYDDIFAAKLTSAGTWDWATRAGGNSSDVAAGLAIDDTGNLYVTGSFASTISFGSHSITSAGFRDAYLARLTPTGVWQWATSVGCRREDDYGFDVATDSAGNVYLAGGFNDTIRIGSNLLVNPGPYKDVFVSKLTPAGVWQWAVSAGGDGYDYGSALTVSPDGAVFSAGSFDGQAIAFGPTTLASTSNSLFGNSGIFLARLDQFAVGLPEAEAASSFTLSPNPAHHTARLTGLPPGITPVQVVDVLGRVVRTTPRAPHTADLTLDLAGLPPGLYTVRAGRAARRLVVE